MQGRARGLRGCALVAAMAASGGCSVLYSFGEFTLDASAPADRAPVDGAGRDTSDDALDAPSIPTDTTPDRGPSDDVFEELDAGPLDDASDDPTADVATDASDDAPPCSAGTTACNGACVDLTSDASHCGACGNRCALPGAVAVCSSGACIIAGCLSGSGDCDSVPSDGCETDLRSPTNCGACGRHCGLGTECVGGTCVGCSLERIACTPGAPRCCNPLVCGMIIGRSPYVGCCRALGTACVVGNTCCAGGQCQGGRCCGVATLGCSMNAQCCSGVCTSGRCA